MISIIVCSININFFKKLKLSIENTIGFIEYEIIRIDNLQEKLSITKAYNLGINKSKYDFLVFVHEDVIFHTKNWGSIFLEIFKNDNNIGLIGVAGAKYKSRFPSAFWHTKEKLLDIHLIQHFKNKKASILSKGFLENVEDAVVVDGVCMVLDKRKKIIFNDKVDGFHCYDTSLSLDVLKNKLKIKVTNKVLIEHFSSGNVNTNFVKAVLKFHKLYKNELPLSVINNKDSGLEIFALRNFLKECLNNNFVSIKFLFMYFVNKPFDRLNYDFFKLIIYKIIKSKIKC